VSSVVVIRHNPKKAAPAGANRPGERKGRQIGAKTVSEKKKAGNSKKVGNQKKSRPPGKEVRARPKKWSPPKEVEVPKKLGELEKSHGQENLFKRLSLMSLCFSRMFPQLLTAQDHALKALSCQTLLTSKRQNHPSPTESGGGGWRRGAEEARTSRPGQADPGGRKRGGPRLNITTPKAKNQEKRRRPAFPEGPGEKDP
jgi:hypothetical protein